MAIVTGAQQTYLPPTYYVHAFRHTDHSSRILRNVGGWQLGHVPANSQPLSSMLELPAHVVSYASCQYPVSCRYEVDADGQYVPSSQTDGFPEPKASGHPSTLSSTCRTV